MKNGIQKIFDERSRQLHGLGFTLKHDKQHSTQTLGRAAMAYLYYHYGWGGWPTREHRANETWPFSLSLFKPKDELRAIAKAGALCAAVIDRAQIGDLENQLGILREQQQQLALKIAEIEQTLGY